jgi:hypothetical protein
VAKPKLTAPTDFPSKLHKGMGRLDPATVYGDHIAVGDDVNVNGTRGRKPTSWVGTIAADNGDGSFEVTDLTVDHAEEFRMGKDKEAGAGAGGTEDVAVTVSNLTDTSDPVLTASVPTVP